MPRLASSGAFQWFLVGITPVDAIPGLADAAEAARMDREYRIWKIVVAAACVVVALLYVVPLAIG